MRKAGKKLISLAMAAVLTPGVAALRREGCG